MSVGSNHQYYNLRLVNSIDQAVFLGDASAPLSRPLTFELFWATSSCMRMFLQFCDKFTCLGKSLGVACLKSFQISNSILSIVYGVYHQPTRFKKSSSDSSGNMRCTSPRFACSSERSSFWKYSACVKHVGSACFSATSLRKYFTARRRRFSSSAITRMERSISAFSCTAVITQKCLILAAKVRKRMEREKEIVKKMRNCYDG